MCPKEGLIIGPNEDKMKLERFQIKAMINNVKVLLNKTIDEAEAIELLKDVTVLESGEEVWDFIRNKYKDEYSRLHKNK